MPKIYSITEPFDLDQLRFNNPVSKNGSHFIKMQVSGEPLYFLAPKCYVRHGFVEHGKKTFCDFVFSNDDTEFLTWMENLEETVRKAIYNNREKWFETPLDEHDIESSMASPYKPYKSGKFFIVRSNVPTALGKINIKIYDEQERETEPENIKEDTNVMVVLEFQGIKCSARSFQFEIVLKQMLVVEPEKLFEKCIIPKASNKDVSKIPVVPEPQSSEVEVDIKEEMQEIDAPILSAQEIDAPVSKEQEDPPLPSLESAPVEITEVDLVNTDPPIQLKNRNDVYYKLYKEARTKAREAKQVALANYLEAKRIKNTYLLEDMSESDEDDNLNQIDSDEDDYNE